MEGELFVVMCTDLCVSELIWEPLCILIFFVCFVFLPFVLNDFFGSQMNQLLYTDLQWLLVSIVIVLWTFKEIFLIFLLPRSQVCERQKNCKAQRPYSFLVSFSTYNSWRWEMWSKSLVGFLFFASRCRSL